MIIIDNLNHLNENELEETTLAAIQRMKKVIDDWDKKRYPERYGKSA